MPITITATPVVIVVGRNINHFGVGEIVDLQVAVAHPGHDASLAMGCHNGGRPMPLLLRRWPCTRHLLRPCWRFDNHPGTKRPGQLSSYDQLDNCRPSNWSLGPSQYNDHQADMAQRTGRYLTDNINNNNHHQATFGLGANWINIGNSRINVGLQAAASPRCIAIAIDRVSSHAFAPPFTNNGSFTWRIPWTYRLMRFPVGQPQDIHGQAVQVPDRGHRQCDNVITHCENLVGNAMTISKGGRTFIYNATQAAVGNAVIF